LDYKSIASYFKFCIDLSFKYVKNVVVA